MPILSIIVESVCFRKRRESLLLILVRFPDSDVQSSSQGGLFQIFQGF